MEEPTFADSMAKYYPELAFMEFNPHDFEKYWTKQNHSNMKQIEMPQPPKVTWRQSFSILIALAPLAVGLITLVLRIYYEVAIRVWMFGDWVFSHF